MSDRLDELVGPLDDPAERARLERVHELLLAAAPPPALPAARRPPAQRRLRPALLLAAALAAAAFGGGWLLGDRSDDVAADFVIPMSGVGPERDAEASIEVLPQDASGNWPMLLHLRGLEPSRDRDDAYELWLTRDGELAASCGVFTVHEGQTTVTLSVPYALRRFDGWVVTRRGSEEILLST